MKGPTKFIISKYLFHKLAGVTVDDLKSLAPREIEDRATKYSVSRILVNNPKDLFWAFSVRAPGSPVYVTRFKFEPKEKAKSLRDLDVKLRCTCGFFRWGGVAFHALKNNYLLGREPWAGISPNVRDPKKKNFVCKHLLAAIDYLDNISLREFEKK